MICSICGKEYEKGYKGPRFQNEKFCSEECYLQRKPKRGPGSLPKPRTLTHTKLSTEELKAVYKPDKGSMRRKLTDYIQDWWPWEPNWQWITKQIKDICDEYELTYEDMYYVLKYCKEFEDVELNPEYGLYQFFPRYIEPTQSFRKSVVEAKQKAQEIDMEETYEIIKRKPSTRKWIER